MAHGSGAYLCHDFSVGEHLLQDGVAGERLPIGERADTKSVAQGDRPRCRGCDTRAVRPMSEMRQAMPRARASVSLNTRHRDPMQWTHSETARHTCCHAPHAARVIQRVKHVKHTLKPCNHERRTTKQRTTQDTTQGPSRGTSQGATQSATQGEAQVQCLTQNISQRDGIHSGTVGIPPEPAGGHRRRQRFPCKSRRCALDRPSLLTCGSTSTLPSWQPSILVKA